MADFPQLENTTALTATLVRYDDRYGVFQSESAPEFRWPIKNLPDSVKLGESVTFTAATQKTQQESQYIRMRQLLEEMIN